MRLNALVIDLAVLGPQGWNYLEQLCTRLPGLGVVVCTGQSSVAQRVRGLRLGADDWMTKPCHPEELIARVEAVVRRRKRAEARVDAGPLVVGEVEIRPDQFQAFVGGASVELTRREFELIPLLADAQGQVLQREEIYQRVWGYAMAHGDRSVDVFVRKLRQKLERASPGWRYIHTHFGIGYRFAAEPSTRSGVPSRAVVAGAGRSRTRRVRSAAARSRLTRPPAIVSGVGPDRNKLLRNFAILILIAVVVWQLPGGGRRRSRSTTSWACSSPAASCSSATGCTWSTACRFHARGPRPRAPLRLGGLLAFALVATRRLWDGGGFGVLVWLALIGAGVYGCVTVYRASREY